MSFTQKCLFLLALTLLAAPVFAGNVWYPEDGSWDGTAPSCDGECASDEFAWCVGMNPGCAYSEYAYSPPGFGSYCNSGRKAYCVKDALFPQVNEYERLNSVGQWRGSAPSCSGDCHEGEFALCRSSDGDSCAYTDGVDASALDGFGHHCSSGRKAFCVPISYLSGE